MATQRAASARAARSRAKVLATARAILERDGFIALTMERVAAESGAAKTTLYRHWPTKAALCIDVYMELAQRVLQDRDTGDVAQDLKGLVRDVIRLQTRTVAGAALLGLIGEAQFSEQARDKFLAEFADRRRTLSRQILQRALGRRQIRPGTDVELVIDALGGATTFRLLQGHGALNRRFADGLVDLLLDGIRPGKSR
jgi:AcrR family transcriptional regulator